MTNVLKEDIESIKGMIKKEKRYIEEVRIEKPKEQEGIVKKETEVEERSEQISLPGIHHAEIVDASIHRVFDLWRKKPQGLSFTDTDAIIVTAKTSDGDILRETFYTCIKPDGTINMKSLSHASQAKRKRLADFLIHNKITGSMEGYNVRERISEWKGKRVEVIPLKNGSLAIGRS